MKRLHVLLLVPAACLAALAGGLIAGSGRAAPGETVRSVDIGRILEEHPPFVGAYEQLVAKYKPEIERLRQLEAAIKAQKGELAQMDPGSEAYAIRAFEIGVQEKTLAARADYYGGAQRREREKLLQLSVTRIHEACAAYGERNGVGAVVMKPGLLPGSDEDGAAAVRDLEGRWVIWSHPDHDVTDQILAILREP